MNYIQNKLDDFHNKFCEFTDGGVLVHYCKDGNCLDEFITQIFTDYHNHIVEKVKNEQGDIIQDPFGLDDEFFSKARILSLLKETKKI